MVTCGLTHSYQVSDETAAYFFRETANGNTQFHLNATNLLQDYKMLLPSRQWKVRIKEYEPYGLDSYCEFRAEKGSG